MDEEKKMKTFEVECQMTYYGRVCNSSLKF